MIKTVKNILILTLSAIAATSCSLALLNDKSEELTGSYKIVVTGIASDITSNSPLEGIQVTFSAYHENTLSVLPIVSKTVRTNSEGIYTIQAEGFSEAITCTITAGSVEKDAVQYQDLTQKVMVTWSGDSFDESSNTFFVNDCNFQLEKQSGPAQ